MDTSKPLKRQAVLSVLAHHKPDLAARYGITKLGIFGSVARDEASAGSDVDVVVETQVPSLFMLVHLKEELQALLNTDVDIVRYRPRMNEYLKRRIDDEACYV